MQAIFKLTSLLLAAAALSACGSSSSDDLPPTLPPASNNEVPATAFASPGAYSSFAGSLASTETGDPLILGAAAAPTSETEEPLKLN